MKDIGIVFCLAALAFTHVVPEPAPLPKPKKVEQPQEPAVDTAATFQR